MWTTLITTGRNQLGFWVNRLCGARACAEGHLAGADAHGDHAELLFCPAELGAAADAVSRKHGRLARVGWRTVGCVSGRSQVDLAGLQERQPPLPPAGREQAGVQEKKQEEPEQPGQEQE